MLQAFGPLYMNELNLKKNSHPFTPEIISQDILKAIEGKNFTEFNTISTASATFNGTNYNKGKFLLLRRNEHIIAGKIILIISTNEPLFF